MIARSWLALGVAGVLSSPVGADWLVFRSGQVLETKGSWNVVGRQVQFHATSGVLQSLPAVEVDLAASAFLSWQVGDRRSMGAHRPPAGAELRRSDPAGGKIGEAACLDVEVVEVWSGETLELRIGGRSEIVHLACLDAPEADYKLQELATFGIDAYAVLASLAPRGNRLCWIEEVPPLRDADGHRIGYLQTRDGRDLGADLVGRGLALVRSGACARRELYLKLEQQALATERGNWGAVAHELALAIVGIPVEGVRGGSRGGGRGGLSALPPRRQPVRRA